ncbi:hypothetical protein Ahy_A06g028360 [Arachis hypogaea]|uniref:Uncharacterized protein n=1 Tax=Arachis hypogaea TaxID=3818 RepID=A0A445CQV6_ARAHY|nr:hypothetical protein Ahy_A06g028360 [Arachis hypogaea]
MESSEEEIDFEIEIDLAELKKGPPYVCSLLRKLPSSEKSNESKLKSGKKYSFDISKSDQIFDVLLKDKQLILPEVTSSIDVSPCGRYLLDFLVQQKIKDRDVSLCPRCNAVFDAEAVAIFEKERMKKEL